MTKPTTISELKNMLESLHWHDPSYHQSIMRRCAEGRMTDRDAKDAIRELILSGRPVVDSLCEEIAARLDRALELSRHESTAALAALSRELIASAALSREEATARIAKLESDTSLAEHARELIASAEDDFVF